MKALLILLLAAFIFMGCNISANPDTVSLKLDSAIEQVRQLNISLKAEDSIKNLAIKMSFAAGYKSGINCVTEHPRMSFNELNYYLQIESFKFSKLVDETFPINKQ